MGFTVCFYYRQRRPYWSDFRRPYRHFPNLLQYIGTNKGLKSWLDMRDNSKCITISVPTSTWSHCFVGIEGNLGRVYWLNILSGLFPSLLSLPEICCHQNCISNPGRNLCFIFTPVIISTVNWLGCRNIFCARTTGTFIFRLRIIYIIYC